MSLIKRELVQLSHVYSGQNLAGMFESPKLDGFRMWWDGGVSRNIPKEEIPWANLKGDERYLVKQIATGLWTRYGNVVHAPAWFLDQLPKGQLLDGEAFSELLSRQQIRSICSTLIPDDIGWAQVQFHVINRWSPEVLFKPGIINNPNYQKIISPECLSFFYAMGGHEYMALANGHVYKHLLAQSENWEERVIRLVKKNKIPYTGWQEYIARRLEEEMGKLHGEGLIAEDPNATADVKRVYSSLKIKPRDDAEAVVVGYISARDGKLRGMMGAAIVEWNGVRFELSGFTDEERRLSDSTWAWANLEKEIPDDIYAVHFPRGKRVTFSYRGLTDAGVPNEAAYYRGRD